MENLFDEFQATSVEQWKAQIEKDLKGISFDKLITKTHNEITINPFYTKENLSKNAGLLNDETEWEVCQQIHVTNETHANLKALRALEGGASGLSFYVHNKINVAQLLKGISLENIYTQFYVSAGAYHLFEDLKGYIGKQNKFDNKIKCFVNADPLCQLAYTGNWNENLKNDLSIVEKVNCLSVNVGLYEEAGASTVNELAIGLAHLNEYFHFLHEKNKLKNKVIHVRFSIGPDFFTEIAKLRAFRSLMGLLQNQYGINTEVHIHAQTAMIDKSAMDMNNNLLRTTTEAMSAIIGGANSISVLPYDESFSKENDFSDRIARNQLLILKNESYLDKVADISAGSYYIESITDQLAQKAWEQFKVIEQKGGYLACLKKNYLQHLISKDLLQLKKEMNEGKLVLLGVNKYQHPSDKLSFKNEDYTVFNSKTEVTPIRPVRLAFSLEQSKLVKSNLSKVE